MNFFSLLRDWFIKATQYFVDLALASYSSWYIPEAIGDAFVALSRFTAGVATALFDASAWYDNVTNQITTFLTRFDLEDWFREWKWKILYAWSWVSSAWSNVTSILELWWSSTWSEIKALIDIATEGLDNLKVSWNSFWVITFPQWTGKLDSLSASWDNFWTTIYPTLFDIKFAEEWWRGKATDIGGLINTAFTEREGFWAGWQDFRDKVTQFFTDPVEFIWARFTDWFLGPEV